MQLANGQVYKELFTKQQQAGLQHAPGKSLQHLHTKAGCDRLCRMAWQMVLVIHLISSLSPMLIQSKARQSAGSHLAVACCSWLPLLISSAPGRAGDQLPSWTPHPHVQEISLAGICQGRQLRHCWQTCPTRATACCNLLQTFRVVLATSPFHTRSSRVFSAQLGGAQWPAWLLWAVEHILCSQDVPKPSKAINLPHMLALFLHPA